QSVCHRRMQAAGSPGSCSPLGHPFRVQFAASLPRTPVMNRREFLSAAATATATAGLAVAKDDPKMMPLVDCHQHLWDLSKLKLAWVKEGEPLAHSFTPKEYAAATKGLNIVKSVYMEVDVVEADEQKEVDYLIELIKSKSSP